MSSPSFITQKLSRTTLADVNASHTLSTDTIRQSHKSPAYAAQDYKNAPLPLTIRSQDRHSMSAMEEESNTDETSRPERACEPAKKRRVGPSAAVMVEPTRLKSGVLVDQAQMRAKSPSTGVEPSTLKYGEAKKEQHKRVEKDRRSEQKGLIGALELLIPEEVQMELRINVDNSVIHSHTKDNNTAKNAVLQMAIIYLKAMTNLLTTAYDENSSIKEECRTVRKELRTLREELERRPPANSSRSRGQLSIASLCSSNDTTNSSSQSEPNEVHTKRRRDTASLTDDSPWLADSIRETLRVGKQHEMDVTRRKRPLLQ